MTKHFHHSTIYDFVNSIKMESYITTTPTLNKIISPETSLSPMRVNVSLIKNFNDNIMITATHRRGKLTLSTYLLSGICIRQFTIL